MPTAKLSLQDARTLAAAARQVQAAPKNITPPKVTNAHPVNARVEGLLLTDLAASSNNGRSSTTAQIRLYRGQGAAWNEAEVATVVNRRDCLSATAGSYVIALELNGELRPLVTCSPASSSSSSSSSGSSSSSASSSGSSAASSTSSQSSTASSTSSQSSDSSTASSTSSQSSASSSGSSSSSQGSGSSSDCACGHCDFTWSSLAWHLGFSNCSGGCGCTGGPAYLDPPRPTGDFEGQVVSICCVL